MSYNTFGNYKFNAYTIDSNAAQIRRCAFVYDSAGILKRTEAWEYCRSMVIRKFIHICA